MAKDMLKANVAPQKDTLGITVKKAEDFGEWFSQVIQKADLIDYSEVSGCYVYKPGSYAIWETVQAWLDVKFKALGVKNAYFPLLIPESLLKREAQHVAGFTPEVAWVTHSGETKLAERLAVRPTSETVMYAHYAKWIKSHRDLPLLLNQWCNVVRWEFKNPVPFLRSREFLWQEGHTAHKSKADAMREVLTILDIYAEAYAALYAVPVIKGYKTESEKFAGALCTTSIEGFLPNGRGIQCATSHCLGQNFAKAFAISFLDENEEKQYVWQNSWGFTTRSIGVAIMMHSDDKGLVLPPAIATTKAVIVPILFDDSRTRVLAKAKELHAMLQAAGIPTILDDRDHYTSGWKFNEWELKGIPLRIEIGPKDLEKSSVVVVRRDIGKKEFIPMAELLGTAKAMLGLMQKDLYERALKFREDNTATVKDRKALDQAIADRKLANADWCGNESCEALLKERTEGAKILCIPFTQPKKFGNCAECGKPGKHRVFIAKSY